MAEIFRQHGPEYLREFSDRMLQSHKRVMYDIIRCRTPDLGGQTWFCEDCNEYHYSYHSCRNRHCPQCQNDRIDQWLEQQKELLLPVTYFMATFTLSAELRAMARSNQKKIYNLFFRTSAEALQDLALDKRFVGGTLGMLGVLQTWTRDLRYHIHIHYIIPGGGLSPDGKKWKRAKNEFLIHEKPLAKRFKGILIKALKKEGLYEHIPKSTWSKQWVVDVESMGNGEAVLKYLAPYVFRVAISNRNILNLRDGKVTFRYKHAKTTAFKTCTLDATEFIQRFLQHVLPKGFVKIRYFGFLATKKRHVLDHVKELLSVLLAPMKKIYQKASKPFCCPKCGRAMTFIAELPRKRGPPWPIVFKTSTF